jgi:hypothetical protein
VSPTIANRTATGQFVVDEEHLTVVVDEEHLTGIRYGRHTGQRRRSAFRVP